MMRVGVGFPGGVVPVATPDTAALSLPLVASLATVTLPLNVPAAAGVQVNVTLADAPGATVPVCGLSFDSRI